jgi:hypothetical protein
MATDMAGYSRPIGTHEEGTLNRLKERHREPPVTPKPAIINFSRADVGVCRSNRT